MWGLAPSGSMTSPGVSLSQASTPRMHTHGLVRVSRMSSLTSGTEHHPPDSVGASFLEVWESGLRTMHRGRSS